MNDREFVCSRTIPPYFSRTGLIIEGGGGVFVGKVYLLTYLLTYYLRSSTIF